MSNFDFLQKYLRLQERIMFDEIIDLGFAKVAYSLIDKSGYWNNALTNQILEDSEISEIEKALVAKDRTPAIYFENTPALKGLAEALEKNGYKEGWEDCWQFWNNGLIDNKHFESVVKVETLEQLEVFINTFNACYQKDDPQNPYGELGDYLKTVKDAWLKHGTTNRLEYFIVYKGDKPVAVSTLTNFEGVGYISNVGSLREVRGEGYGKAATLFCINESIKNGNTEHCLATEEGAYPNDFYKRIGFVNRFTATGYMKFAK